MNTDKIMMVHGSGGSATGELINEIFAKAFDNDVLNEMEDSAVVSGAKKIAMTTDSFVVTPTEFPGGDIGRLAVCGTVNDLLMRGAIPKYLTCGFILEEGASIETLQRVVRSMAATAKEADVKIVAGDTKVVEGKGEIYINTAGVGFVEESVDISAKNTKAGDVVIVSGTMGDHHAAILGQRMEIEHSIESDNAPLTEMVLKMLRNGRKIHTLRDVTRGGLATVLKELAVASRTTICLEQNKIPVTPVVRDFCGLLGLDPLYMGNEGKMVAIVAAEDAEAVLEDIRTSTYGKDAAIIGTVSDEDTGKLLLKTSIGGIRNLEVLMGEGLPRIC